MKSIFYYPALILCFILLSFTNTNYVTDNSINLEEALKKGIIKIKVQGLGGYSGECLSATLQNVSRQKVTLKINPGIVFNPDDNTMQDILIVREQVIVLNNSNSKTVKLFGFCCKSENRSPEEGMNFKIAKNTNPKLIEVANYLNKSNYSIGAMQSAVWSVSDGNSVSEIYSEKPEEVKPLRTEVCRLTGQTDNWYSTNINRTVDQRGYIQSEPVSVNGLITVNLEKPATIYQGIYKENGEIIEAPKKLFDVPGKGELTFKFLLKVKGWEKGKYFVKVTLGDKEMLKQDFRI